MPTSAQAIIALVLFVVPGYVFTGFKNTWLSVNAKAADRIIESVTWSVVVYAVSSVIPDRLFDLARFRGVVSSGIDKVDMLFTGPFLTSYLFLISLAFACAFGYIVVGQYVLKPFSKTNVGMWSLFWRETRFGQSRRPPVAAVVEMKDGATIWGVVKAASTEDNERTLWLEGFVLKEEASLPPNCLTNIWVDCSDANRIHMFQTRSDALQWLVSHEISLQAAFSLMD